MADFAKIKQELIKDHYPLYINGEWVEGSSGKTFDTYCPSNGEKLASIAAADNEDVDAAVDAAWNAFPAWRATPLAERVAIMDKIYAALQENFTKFNEIDALDTCMTIPMLQAYQGMGIIQFSYFSSCIQTAEDGTNSEAPGMRTMVVREPLGVIGAITPWNVPFTLACWKIAPALAAGNCVVLKPSSYTPLSSLLLAEVLSDLLPPGVFNVINGKGSTTGQYMLEHPGFSKLTFTGSTEVGRTVGIAAAQNIIPATLELGGKSAGIYFADTPQAMLEGAVVGAAFEALINSGQVCIMCSRVLVEEPIYDAFVEGMIGFLKTAKIGMPWEDDTMIGPLAYEGHMNDVMKKIEKGKQEGATLAYGGNRITDGELGKGFFIEPTIFTNVDPSMSIAQEEIFGPVLSVIKFNGEEEAIRIANDSKYGLHGSVFTGDLAKGLRVADGVRTGTMNINGNAGRTVGGNCFGGCNESGIGRENYKTSLDHFSQLKTINFTY